VVRRGEERGSREGKSRIGIRVELKSVDVVDDDDDAI